MDKLSMKTMDIGLQTTGNVRSSSQTQDTSGDFRKMLEGKNEDSSSSQVKQDNKNVSSDTKQDKVEASDDTKKDTASKAEGSTKEEEKTEIDTNTDTRQAEEMIAAQLRERFSYGFVQPEQKAETESEGEVSGIVVETEDTGLEELVQPAASEEQTAEPVQEQMPETGKVEPVQTNRATEQIQTAVQNTAADVKTVETVPVTRADDSSETKQQTQDFSSQLKNTAKTSQTEEKSQTQSDDSATEPAAAVAAEPAKVIRTEEPVQENVTVTVHVSQPEELPEKVTDQLLAKLTTGVQEFEIHIEPANLGKIAIKVLYEGSQATISLICSEKHAMEVLGNNAKEIGNIINRNLGGETTIIVDKQETDYLNQTRDENEQAGQNAREQKEENSKSQNTEDAEQFLQKLRLGLAG